MLKEIREVKLTTQFGDKLLLTKDDYIITLYTTRIFFGGIGCNIPPMNNNYTSVDCRIGFHPKIKGINTLDDVFSPERYDKDLYEKNFNILLDKFKKLSTNATISEISFVDDEVFEYKLKMPTTYIEYNVGFNTIDFSVKWREGYKDDIEILKSYLT
jgi:hypothetical protein